MQLSSIQPDLPDTGRQMKSIGTLGFATGVLCLVACFVSFLPGQFVLPLLQIALALSATVLVVTATLARRQLGRAKPKREPQTRVPREDAELLAEIAELTKREADLTASLEKAQGANQAKSDFLAKMSHEIRTPLTAILGFTEVLLSDKKWSRDHQSNRSLWTIRRNGEHLLDLVNDILDLSKIEANQVELETIRFSPVETVREVVSLFRPRAGNAGLELKTEFRGALPSTISSDPTRLRQILINLIGNAIKFTESGSVQVILELEASDLFETRLMFEVRDSGIGISEEQMERLFKPFCQASPATSRRFGGTGLGLAISQRLTSMLGGEICCETTFGEGSCFRFTIATGPLDGVEMVRHSAATPEPVGTPDTRPEPDRPVLSGLRLLLAEDGPDNQRLISFVLRKAGAEVEVAEDGKAALELVLGEQATTFDAVLMDMQMPFVDGFDATRQLRAAGIRWPIIALTADAMSDVRDRCLQTGCSDFVTKPLDVPHLLDTLVQATRETAPSDAGKEVDAANIYPD